MTPFELLRRMRHWLSTGGNPDGRNLARQALQGPAANAAVIPSLVWKLDVRDPAAAQAIDFLMSGLPPSVLALLDDTVRDLYEWQHWQPLPQQLTQLAHGLSGALGAFSLAPSGYVREAAVRALARVEDGRELPFLLIRLNDWVAPVRRAALDAVTARVKPLYAVHFVRCLPLVERLRRQGRADHGQIVTSIVALLRSAESRDALRGALNVEDRPTRRAALRLLIDQGGGDLVEPLWGALDSHDAVMRLWAARELRRRASEDRLRELVQRLKQDRFMPVRREGLYAVIERLPGLIEAEFREALLEPHASIRELARFQLRGTGLDFAAVYRARLGSARTPAELAGAIGGLGETGGAADAAVLAPYLSHERPRTRAAAVRAVARLDADGHADALIAALSDPSPGVASAASRALALRPHLVTAALLGPLLEPGAAAHGALAAARIASNVGWWDSASLLMRGATSAHERVRLEAMYRLRHWRKSMGRLSVAPSPRQLQDFTDRLSAAAANLDGDVYEDLKYVQQYASRNLRPEGRRK